MSALPVWAQWVQWGATIFIALFAAGFAAFIGYRQWRTAHERVVLDLFDRRMKNVEGLRSAVSEVVRAGRSDTATYFRFARSAAEAKMLFGDEVIRLLEEHKDRINRIGYHTTMSEAERADRGDHILAAHELTTELSNFFDESEPLLLPYLRMQQKIERFWKWGSSG